MTRKKGDKDHGIIEKNIIVSLINDYRLFNCSDREMLRLINLKTGKAISWTTFRKYKSIALGKDSMASEWLRTYCNSRIIDHYWTRIKELEYVQRILLEEITAEYSKKAGKRPYLINQLAKTIGETSTKLSDMGASPPIIAKLYSMIPQEILNGNLSANIKDPVELQKYLKLFHDNMTQDRTGEKAIPQLVDKENVSKNNESKGGVTTTEESEGNRDDNKINPLSAETAIPPAIDQKTDNGSDGGTQDETATAQGDQPIF